jgi:hypothetical protein
MQSGSPVTSWPHKGQAQAGLAVFSWRSFICMAAIALNAITS